MMDCDATPDASRPAQKTYVAWLPHDEAPSLLGEVPAGLQLVTGANTALSASNAAFVVLPQVPGPEQLAVLAGLPGLKVVQLMSSGYDHVLAHIPGGVTLCTARGSHTVPVAEWVLTAILACTRGLPGYVRRQADGSWDQYESGTVAGLRVLLVGYGSIAAAVEARLVPFGVAISRAARHERPGVHPLADLDNLLEQADIVVLLLPGGEATRGLIDRRRLDLLAPGALLVNAGRGSVVDTRAMTDRVRSGRLRVALDVVDPEPLPPEHELWRLEGSLVTPHVASEVTSRLPTLYGFVGRQLRSFALGGRLENVVSDE